MAFGTITPETADMHLGDNLQTTCQHCGSVFRITQEQLDAARGQVRCSQCSQVFNSLLTLENQTGPIAASATPARDNQDAKDKSSEPDNLLQAQVSLQEAMYGTEHSQSHGSLKPVLWLVGILTLVILTLVQLIYYQRYALIESSSYQQQVLNLCRLLPCDVSRFSSLAKIKLIERNVFSHPTHDKALMISGSFQNKAPFAQALPRLLISLSDISGELIGNRAFSPDEYLVDKSISQLQPGKVIQFRLEIADPGTKALTYEFEFLDD